MLGFPRDWHIDWPRGDKRAMRRADNGQRQAHEEERE
jgi:hypothetical protein